MSDNYAYSQINISFIYRFPDKEIIVSKREKIKERRPALVSDCLEIVHPGQGDEDTQSTLC